MEQPAGRGAGARVAAACASKSTETCQTLDGKLEFHSNSHKSRHAEYNRVNQVKCYNTVMYSLSKKVRILCVIMMELE